ncbi:hypothetical protein [Mesorhizobium sp. GbtcB19]|uniref:hypothetical protein n=1 Tax=Mesorhizobium sp. GbtcB19 TaxID=2824764 RepID=UPI001C2FF0E8|nr:hypothetical protein [Mesorhizobium sp. GbtcB19]
MSKEDIPAFVQAVIETGCDICAVGYDGYVIGDADLPSAKRNEVQPILRRISRGYGERDHLRREIVLHLRSLGRFVENGAIH